MNRQHLFVFILMITSSYGYDKPQLYPKEVSDFISMRDQCDHLRGEISGEPEIDEARNLNAELDKYCKGTDKKLENLKQKYKNNPIVIKKLNTYDAGIECLYNCDSAQSTPSFADYKVAEVYKGKNHVLVQSVDSNPVWQEARNDAIKQPVNFAGHYIVYTEGCGGGAICGEIIDAKTGKIVSGFPNAYLIEDDEGNNGFEVDHFPDSSLIIISGIAADPEVDIDNKVLPRVYRVRYLNFVNNKLILIKQDENLK